LNIRRILTLGYVPYGTGRVAPFDQVFDRGLELNPFSRPDQIKDCDALVIWGGGDISPTIYGEPVKGSHASVELSARDKIEVAIMEQAIAAGVPIIGICRGAQLACALAGGKLKQHVDGHHGNHGISTKEGRSIITSSVHHQMMVPDGTDHEFIAVDSRNGIDPEILYFPKIKALAIQGHPEFMDERCEFVQYCLDLTREYVLNKQVAIKEAA